MDYADHDPDEEAELARLLADFEGRLGVEDGSTVPIENPSTASAARLERLADAQACVVLLDEIWPHVPRSEPESFAAEELPATIGPFRVLRELGRGGFGIVYLAEDDRLGRQVAVKVQRPEAIISTELRGRFLREAQAAARLHHPHIAHVFEIGEAGVQIWIASEFIGGGSLAAWLAAHHGPVPPRTSATLVLALADAVECAHRQGVWHRDLKPGNVLLESQDSQNSPADLAGFQPKLIDFSLAKLYEANHSVTRTGALIGTPSNMAPEQAMGNVRQIGPATDVYGLGTILYELLAGQRPFWGANDMQTLRRVVEDEPRRLAPVVPADLAAICLKCLEKTPDHRYPSAARLAEDLRRFLAGEPTEARPLSPAERVSKWMSRRPLLAALICLACVSVTAITALSTVHSWRVAAALDVSERERQAAIDARADAEVLRNEAVRDRDANEHFSYAARMRQAADARTQGNINTTADLLAKYDEGTRGANLRGYEWHYLRRSLHNERAMLRGHEGEVYGVAFSPDGRVLASGGEDGTIRLWDPTGGHQLRTIEAHSSCTNDLSFSPDGQLLASASCDHSVKLWSTNTWQAVATIHGYDEIVAISFSPDGQYVASGDVAGSVNIWKVPTGKLVRLLAFSGEDRNAINAMEWSADGRWLAFPSGVFGYVSIWDTRDWTLAQELPAGAPITVAFSPDGERVAFNSFSAVQVHDTATGKLIAMHDVRTDKVHKVTFTPDGRQLCCGGSDRLVAMWTLPSNDDFVVPVHPRRGGGQEIRMLAGHTARVQDLAISPDGRCVATAGYDGAVGLWEVFPRGTIEPTIQFNVHGSASFGAERFALSADLSRLLTIASNKNLEIWDVEQRCSLGDRLLPHGPKTWLSLAPDTDRFAVSYEGPEDAWFCRVSDLPERIAAEGFHPFHNLAFSPDSRFFAAICRDGAARVWDFDTGKIRHTVELSQQDPGSASISLSSDGRRLAVGHSTPGIVDLKTGQTIALPIPHAVSAHLQFSPDDSLLLVRKGSDLELVDTATGESLRSIRLPLHAGTVACSPDGKTLAAGSIDAVTFWHTETGQEVGSILLPGDRRTMRKLQFSADGKRLAVVVSKAHPDQPDSESAALYIW